MLIITDQLHSRFSFRLVAKKDDSNKIYSALQLMFPIFFFLIEFEVCFSGGCELIVSQSIIENKFDTLLDVLFLCLMILLLPVLKTFLCAFLFSISRKLAFYQSYKHGSE